MSFSDTNQAKKYASIAEVAAAEAKVYARNLESAPDYAEQARLSAESAAANALSADQSASAATLSQNAASDFATQAAASAAEAGSSAGGAIARSVKVPDGEVLSDLPPAASRVNSVVVFNAGADSAVKPLSDFAILDSSGKIPASIIPAVALSEVFVVNSQAAMLALVAQEGDIAKRTDKGISYVLAADPASSLSNWIQINDDVLAQLAQSTGASLIGYNAETLKDVADRVDLKINGANSFSAGATLSSQKDFIWDAASSSWYYWSGAYPKTVAASSSPASTGGISPGAWSPVSSSYLQSLLIAANGVNYVNGAVKTVATFSGVKSGSHANALYLVTVEHHVGGLGGASYQRSGTTGTPSSGNEALCYDADGVGWKMVKQPIQRARSFGVLGNGVDDKASLRLAVDFVGQNGGGVVYVESLSGFDDLKISDTLTIAYSGVEIRLDPTVHIHSESATTDGGTIHFSGPLNNEANRIKRVGIVGGKVSANGSGILDNAVGFSGCEDFYVYDIVIPHADRKALTAQVNVVNGHFKNFQIGTTGYSAVTFEGDTLGAGIISRGMVIEDGTIESAGLYGVSSEGGVNHERNDRVIIRNVRVAQSVRSGFRFLDTNNMFTDKMCRSVAAGIYGFEYSSCTGIYGYTNSLNSQQAGVVYISCSNVDQDVAINGAGLSGTGVYDAIYTQNPTSPHVIRANVTGSTHRYTVNNSGTPLQHLISFPNRSFMISGVSGLLNGGSTAIIVSDGGEVTLTASSNPSVAGLNAVLLSPSTTFTMTTMSNPYVGKQVTVRFNGNVTVQHAGGGAFRLKGASNVTPAAGSIMVFIYSSDSTWIEISRNF